jgi:carboxylesterase
MAEFLIVPQSEPFFFPGGSTGCLLLHGFTSMPEEMRPLGEFLRDQGFTVLGPRLAGHATHPEALARIRWRDWLVDVEESLAILQGTCKRVVVIGQAMGGVLALLAAARYPVAGVVALSTPYDPPLEDWRVRMVRFWSALIPILHKGKTPIWDPRVVRRERDYPAYPFFPTSILGEVEDLKKAMRIELPAIQVPVLIIHSHKDSEVHPDNAQRLLMALPDISKELFWLEDAGHSIVWESRPELAFQKIAQFLVEWGAAPQ